MDVVEGLLLLSSPLENGLVAVQPVQQIRQWLGDHGVATNMFAGHDKNTDPATKLGDIGGWHHCLDRVNVLVGKASSVSVDSKTEERGRRMPKFSFVGVQGYVVVEAGSKKFFKAVTQVAEVVGVTEPVVHTVGGLAKVRECGSVRFLGLSQCLIFSGRREEQWARRVPKGSK